MAADPHIARVWREAAIAAVGGVAFGALGAVVMTQIPPGSATLRMVCVTASLAASVAWAFAFAVRAFAAADEFLRQRDKTAWFWGGIAGVAVSAPIYAFVMLGGLHWLDPARPVGPELARAFGLGYALPIVAQLLGYLAIHVWWKVSKR